MEKNEYFIYLYMDKKGLGEMKNCVSFRIGEFDELFRENTGNYE